ncbi:MAG: alpha/beta fold hydrolase [Pseudonocardia sp.]|nr:alpha/beta fold hydrolase [Pseudonocardia sp.]
MTDRVRVNGIDIAFERFGPPENSPLLLIMGLGTQMLAWREQFCELLVDEGHHVIRFDNRDIGLSTHLHEAPMPDLAAVLTGDTSAAPYRLDDMAADTAGLLDALGIPSAHIVGASMGGMIAQALAIGHPDRVRSLTSIMSTTGAPGVGAATPKAQAALLAPPATTREEAVQRAIGAFRVIGSPGFPMDEESLADTVGRSYDRGYDPQGVTRQLLAVMASGDRTPALRTLAVPTLVVHGEDDPLVGLDGGKATAAAIPGAELLTFPGMGHDLPRQLWRPIVDAITRLTRAASGT